MEDIKFRMWDNTIRQWSHSCGTEFQRDWFLNLSEKNNKAWIILSQFTWFYDKNDKEIFVGDIVKLKAHTEFIYEVKFWFYQQDYDWVKTYHSGFYCEGRNECTYWFDPNYEIIWNVFEDHKLIP